MRKKDVERVAQSMGAEVRGEVRAGGGYFGALRAVAEVGPPPGGPEKREGVGGPTGYHVDAETSFRVIGLLGTAGVGKSLVASILAREFKLVTVGVADPIKRAAMAWWGVSQDALWGESEQRNQDVPGVPGLTVRRVLQVIGTDVARALDEDVWARTAIDTIKGLQASPFCDYSERRGLHSSLEPRAHLGGVVVADMRFENEARAFRASGYDVWRVVRPGYGALGEGHASERADAVPDTLVTATVVNDSTVDDLAARVRGLF